MKQLAKHVIERIVSHRGYQLIDPMATFPAKTTDKRHIQSLLHSLTPIPIKTRLLRLGPNGDGGYLVPDDLVGIKACFSPGVSDVSGFEKDCAAQGMKVFLADKSVESPAESNAAFSFQKKFIGAISNHDFMTLDEWVEENMPDPKDELILQIDIEGYEYETFLSVSDALLRRFRIIVAEFHQLDQLWNQGFYCFASRAFEKILQHHRCVHIHPNNCCGQVVRDGIAIPRIMEFTFLRQDRVIPSSNTLSFPHPLDYDNTGNPPLPLPACWQNPPPQDSPA